MFKLLLYSAALIPVVSLPWMTSRADVVPEATKAYSFDTHIAEPNMKSLSQCEKGTIPVFFHDGLILTHSAEFITESLQATRACDSVDVEIIPVIPGEARAGDIELSRVRMAELNAYVTSVSQTANMKTRLKVHNEPVKEDVSTLYMNGRAAIIQIDPK